MKKVSVIIPLYNAERWVTEGVLADVCRQNYRDMQVIVINDGSKDNTREVLEHRIEQEKDDIEYKVIHQENSGIAETRNRALTVATGNYVIFLDQDDHIPVDYVGHFVDAIEKEQADILLGGYKTVDENGKLICEYHFDGNDPWSKFKFITPWGRIYKRSFIEENRLKFLNYPIGEDIYFNLCAYAKTDRVTFVDYPEYEWVQNRASFSHTVQRKAENTDLRPLFDAILEYVGDTEDLECGYEYFFVKTAMYQIVTTLRGSAYVVVRKNWEQLFGWIEENYPDYRKDIKKIEPQNETKKIRIIVKMLLWMERTKIYPLFLRMGTGFKKKGNDKI